MAFKIEISKGQLLMIAVTILGFLLILYFFLRNNTLSVSDIENEMSEMQSTVPYVGIATLLSLIFLFIGIIISIIYTVKKIQTLNEKQKVLNSRDTKPVKR